jgi:hypothetical protein
MFSLRGLTCPRPRNTESVKHFKEARDRTRDGTPGFKTINRSGDIGVRSFIAERMTQRRGAELQSVPYPLEFLSVHFSPAK